MIVCRVRGCKNQLRNKKNQLCNRHYLHLRRHGDPLYYKVPLYTLKCTMRGCKNNRVSVGLCIKHYDRLKKSGDPTKTKFHVEKHGMHDHPLYITWQNMKARCYKKYAASYKSYGGRGIKMCKPWKNSFSTFVKDVGEKPTPKHTLDRINNDGNYEPGNVRWATPREQLLNTRLRVDNKSGYKGVGYDKTRNKWRVYTGGGKTRIEHGYFDTLSEAIEKRTSIAIEVAN